MGTQMRNRKIKWEENCWRDFLGKYHPMRLHVIGEYVGRHSIVSIEIRVHWRCMSSNLGVQWSYVTEEMQSTFAASAQTGEGKLGHKSFVVVAAVQRRVHHPQAKIGHHDIIRVEEETTLEDDSVY